MDYYCQNIYMLAIGIHPPSVKSYMRESKKIKIACVYEAGLLFFEILTNWSSPKQVQMCTESMTFVFFLAFSWVRDFQESSPPSFAWSMPRGRE